MPLIELDGCVYDERQFASSHGFESLDPVGREAFVNHLHLGGDDRNGIASQVIEAWATEMRSRWPNRRFRIYRHSSPGEVTIRFHLVRPGIPNWCEEGLEIIEIKAAPIDLAGETA
jgi:hypothetical protein